MQLLRSNMRVPFKIATCLVLAIALTTATWGQSKPPHKIGLALSGGGFRAAAFHLGVLRELHRLGVLDDIDVISCVSGGCIAAGAVLQDWNKSDRFQRLDQYLTSVGFSKISIVTSWLNPVTTSVDALARSYERNLFGNATLGDLKDGPRIYFNATNLSTAERFFFTTGRAPDIVNGFDDVVFRDLQMKQPCDASTFPLARAVAASSAFPPVFNPLTVTHPCLQGQGITSVRLTDGGVYDNQGFGPFLYGVNRWSEDLDFIIVSDGGKPFVSNERPPNTGAGVLTAIHDIQGANIRRIGLDLLIQRHCQGGGPQPIFFSINSTMGEAVPGDAAFASKVPTDLRPLTTLEMKTLLRHGASLVHERLQTYGMKLLPGTSPGGRYVCQDFDRRELPTNSAWERTIDAQ
jgi:NTE family protein